RRLGRYSVVQPLGPRGHVLLGRLDGLGGFQHHVALKPIAAVDPRDPRFAHLASLDHHNIVRVQDVERAGGGFIVAMEYIHGEDLQAVIATLAHRRRQLPIGQVAAIVAAIADGLHYAHERRGLDGRPLRIVHGDPSPSNVMIGYDGSIKLVDFGMTREVDGNIGYMSPEQCRGAGIDRRSDVYTLGVVLYELATASRLFTGESADQIVDRIVHGRIPSPRSRRDDLPLGLCAVIARALSPDPSKRYAAADAFRAALDPFIDPAASGSGVAAMMKSLFGRRPEPWLREPEPVAIKLPPAPARRWSGRVARIGTPTILAIVGILIWQLMPASSRPSAAATTRPAPAVTVLEPLAPLAIPLPELTRATIDRAAAAHARELAHCGHAATRHGEVTIAFTVDALGVVEHAQADSVDVDHDVAACILRSLQHWKFGKQGDDGAHGTYAVVFQ
ncbi:MAG TPA: protein kinase, partial [Kofleriaceae bacterium]|nr:protein kinase [Kofleriaceae bacterium]